MKEKYSGRQLICIVIGSLLFGAGVNLFVTPLNLYNGGGIGIAQILRTLAVQYLHLSFNFDIAGIINLLCNIPLLIIAYNIVSHKFLYGTILSIITETLSISLIPIPSSPLFSDLLVNIICGGAITGYGIGLVLSNSACGGGLDIVGVICALKLKNVSVGKVALVVNTIIYVICALLFNFETAVYSIIYNALFSFVLDHFYVQSIDGDIMVFTKNPDVKQMILKKYGRGVTYWEGQGAYTNASTEVLVIACNKSEFDKLRHDIYEIDPKAFIIVHEGVQVSGGYERRLIS